MEEWRGKRETKERKRKKCGGRVRDRRKGRRGEEKAFIF